MDEKQRDDEGLSEHAKAMHGAMPWISAVWKFIGGAAVGVLAGYWLDKWLGTSPLFILVLTLLGLAVGFYGFIREVNRLGKKK